MHITKECFLPFNVALALQKNSLFTNAFNEKIIQLVEGGLIHKWTNDEFNKIARKTDFHTNLETHALTILHLQVNWKLPYVFDLVCKFYWSSCIFYQFVIIQYFNRASMFFGVVSWYCRSFFSSEKRFGGKSLWNEEGKGLQWCAFHITHDCSGVDTTKYCIYCNSILWVKIKEIKNRI